jgi:hypothetical protein
MVLCLDLKFNYKVLRFIGSQGLRFIGLQGLGLYGLEFIKL